MKHDPVTVVSAFNAAVSAQDLPAALALLDDTFQYVSGRDRSPPGLLHNGQK